MQRKECSTSKRTRKVKSSRLEKGLPMSLVNSTKNCTTTMNKKKLNKKSVRMKMSSIDGHNNNKNEMMRICELQSTYSRKANPQTATESEQNTFKHAMMRRKK